jgi:hypothetical protein
VLRMAVLLVSLLAGVACSPPRVLVVGLDGATWEVIEPLIDAGYLPTLGGLVRSGARFDLDCAPADPASACFCPPVWTSIATGQTRAVHRIKNFYTASWRRGVKAIWDVLYERGGRSTLIAYRGTWPPEASAEIVITEPGAQAAGAQLYDSFPESDHPGASLDFTHTRPDQLFELLDMLPNPVAVEDRLPAWLPFAEDRASMEALLRIARFQRDEPIWARRPDLTMILLHSIDRSEHMDWPGIQPEPGAPIDVAALLERAGRWDGPVFHGPFVPWSLVPAQYQEADEWLAELFEVIEYDYVVLVSDHGMARRASGIGLPGAHDPDHPDAHRGILLVAGPGVVADVHLGTASVLDVAPTVAHLLGLPVGEDLPGRVVVEAFEPGREQLYPVTTVASWEDP